MKRVPTIVEATFQVVSGGPTVHAELLSDDDFAKFRHHREYESLDQSETRRFGGFRHIVKTPGRYHVLLVNRRGSPEVELSLLVRATGAPASTAVGVAPSRQFAILFAALTFFFGTVTWSGNKLLHAYRNR